MISAHDALERLRAGNRRFVSDDGGRDAITDQTRRQALAAGQEPFAIILGCSDSRVPADIVAASQIASVEFGAERSGARLVVVLGHSRCGAVLATLEQLGRRSEDQSRNLRAIVDRIRPAVEPLFSTELRSDPDALTHQCVRANVRMSANQLRHGSEILEQLIQKDGLQVVGAEYSLDTGIVEFFDGVPPAAG
jgi:carbonic anhydrase